MEDWLNKILRNTKKKMGSHHHNDVCRFFFACWFNISSCDLGFSETLLSIAGKFG